MSDTPTPSYPQDPDCPNGADCCCYAPPHPMQACFSPHPNPPTPQPARIRLINRIRADNIGNITCEDEECPCVEEQPEASVE